MSLLLLSLLFAFVAALIATFFLMKKTLDYLSYRVERMESTIIKIENALHKIQYLYEDHTNDHVRRSDLKLLQPEEPVLMEFEIKPPEIPPV